MSFDAWETGIHSNGDYLMHWGIRGMKHGRRRYQNEDGTWTEAGLEARRKREGFGESRKERKAKKAIAKAERHQAKRAAKEQARFERAERIRKSRLSGLTDEELKAKIARARLENEYKDLKKKNSAIETGAKLVSKFLDYKSGREQRAIDLNNQKIEMERLRTQQVQAKTNAIQAKSNAVQSKNRIKISANEAKTAKESRKEAGIKRTADIKRAKAELKDAKGRNRGVIRTALLNLANRGKDRRDKAFELNKMANNLQEQREKRANAEAVAKANTEQAKHKVDQERYKASQEAAKAHQTANEKTWKEIHERTEYEKERKKKKS